MVNQPARNGSYIFLKHYCLQKKWEVIDNKKIGWPWVEFPLVLCLSELFWDQTKLNSIGFCHVFCIDCLYIFFFLVQCIRNKAMFFASALYKAMKGLGTDDKTVIRIIVSRSEVDMVQIKQEFQKAYKKTLESFLKVGID